MRTQLLISAIVLTGATALSGQTRVEYAGTAYQLAGVGAEYKVFGVAGIGSQIVTGRPFSATEERHSVQVLGDGTHIETSETNRLFRDDQGRTRMERTGGNVMIFDPVAGFSAELIAAAREVSKSSVIVREGRVVGRGATFVPLGNNTGAPAELRMDTSLINTASGDKYRAEVAASSNGGGRGGRGGSGGTSAVSGEAGRTITFSTDAGQFITRVGPGDNGAVESLPAQMVNGALAQGMRTTETIPQGKIGNDRPIVIVNERWTSSDLQLLVKSTSSDPRFGDTTYQLTNIVQSSPDPSLFQIPADYTLRK